MLPAYARFHFTRLTLHLVAGRGAFAAAPRTHRSGPVPNSVEVGPEFFEARRDGMPRVHSRTFEGALA